MEYVLYFVIGFPVYLVLLWWASSRWFWGAARALMLREQKDTNGVSEFDKLTAFTRWGILVPGYLGKYLLDTQFNLWFGSFFFAELPREWLFTGRVKRWSDAAHLRKYDWEPHWLLDWRANQSLRWRRELNVIHPGHV